MHFSPESKVHLLKERSKNFIENVRNGEFEPLKYYLRNKVYIALLSQLKATLFHELAKINLCLFYMFQVRAS